MGSDVMFNMSWCTGTQAINAYAVPVLTACYSQADDKAMLHKVGAEHVVLKQVSAYYDAQKHAYLQPGTSGWFQWNIRVDASAMPPCPAAF